MSKPRPETESGSLPISKEQALDAITVMGLRRIFGDCQALHFGDDTVFVAGGHMFWPKDDEEVSEAGFQPEP